MAPEFWKRIFRQGWFLGASAIFIFIYHRVDQIMLFDWQGDASAGLYAAGVRLVEWLQIIPLALMGSLLPLMSAANPEKLEKAYRLSFKYLMLLIVPLVASAFMFSIQLITFVYGADYASTSQAFAILMAAEIFVFLGIVNNTILVATNKQALDPVFTGSSVAVNIVLNIWLIPRLGITGAALASLAAYATGPILGLFIPATRKYSLAMVEFLARPVAAAAIMMGCYYGAALSWPTIVFVLPFIYCTALIILKTFGQDDIQVFVLMRHRFAKREGQDK